MKSVTLGVLGLSVPTGAHICTFFRGSAGRDEIVLPFLAEGIRAQDNPYYIEPGRFVAGQG
jgi:hypothetical protein